MTVGDVNIITVTGWPILNTLKWIENLTSSLNARQQAIAEFLLTRLRMTEGFPEVDFELGGTWVDYPPTGFSLDGVLPSNGAGSAHLASKKP